VDEQQSKYFRTVRSFVRRQGRLTVGQERALEDHWPFYGIEAGEHPLDLDAIFGRSAPKHIEIGIGRGEALLAMAEACPEIDFIGIEVHRPGVGHLLLNAADKGLKNIRIITHDAVEIFKKQIADGSLEGVYLFFPDPWHKKKHNKRRILNAEFAQMVADKLKPGGLFRMATDWEDYAVQMLEVMNACPRYQNCAADNGYMPRFELRPLTKFEKRGQRLGHGTWDLCYARLDDQKS